MKCNICGGFIENGRCIYCGKFFEEEKNYISDYYLKSNKKSKNLKSDTQILLLKEYICDVCGATVKYGKCTYCGKIFKEKNFFGEDDEKNYLLDYYLKNGKKNKDLKSDICNSSLKDKRCDVCGALVKDGKCIYCGKVFVEEKELKEKSNDILNYYLGYYNK